MPHVPIDIMGADPRQYIHGGHEDSEEETEAVGPPKNTRRAKVPWETHKDQIHKLYIVEDRPLPVVMEIMKRSGLYATVKQYRYQIGEKWKWKKYNQGLVKVTPPRSRKSRSQTNLGDAQEEEIVVASDELEVIGRDLDSLRTSLFTDRPLDEKCLDMLRISDVSRCLRLCFHWCKEEIHGDDAEFPAPYGDGTDAETDVTEDNYGCDVRIFIYLLHRYIGSSALAEHDSWDTLVKQTVVGFCPIKMLCTMSTLIVSVVGNAWELSKEANPFTPPPSLSSNVFRDPFDVAKVGVAEIDRWEDEKLLTEFCDEFGAILEDYANYAEAIRSAVRKYMTRNWPGQEVPEEPGFGSDEDHQDGPVLGMYEELIFPVDDLPMDQLSGRSPHYNDLNVGIMGF